MDGRPLESMLRSSLMHSIKLPSIQSDCNFNKVHRLAKSRLGESLFCVCYLNVLSNQ